MDNNAIQKITSLADFAKQTPKTIVLQVEHMGDVIALEVEVLSNYEWMALDHEVPYPERVKDGMTSQGIRYDYNHPDYQMGLRNRTTRIQLKRMARCILAEIPGETNDDKATWLHEHYALGFLSAIAVRLNELHTEGDATIVHRSQTFLSNGATPPADHGTTGTDA